MAMAAQIRAYGEKSYVRFVISGGFNTFLTFAIYSAGILLGLNYLIANFIAWAIGVVVSFLLNSRFVFRKTYAHKRFLTFVFSNILSLLLSMGILSILIEMYSMNPILASIIVIPIVVTTNFFAAKHVVFR